MLEVGNTDVFERGYTQKFRDFTSGFGEFVAYERDRGARDLGLHLTHRLTSGKERLSSALCWFQLKGIRTSTLSSKQFEQADGVKLRLDVKHLQYWFLQPMPTYLVTYIESKDLFLILNIQDYVAKRWGKDVLTLAEATATVTVPTDSVLDEQAFNLILVKSDIAEWRKAIEADEDSVWLCRRDYGVIWHLGTAQQRAVIHRVVFLDWQTKTRGQFYIQERSADGIGRWVDLREHWQFMMTVYGLARAYPYIEFVSNEESATFQVSDEDESECPTLTLSNGDVVVGENCCNEYFRYVMGVRLNDLGLALYDSVAMLATIGLIEITPGRKEVISVAPWHRRDV
jgi:hypothetical protein